MAHMIWVTTPLAKHFDMDKLFQILWRGRKKGRLERSPMLKNEKYAHVYPFSPTPQNFKNFVHIEMLGKRCISLKMESKKLKIRIVLLRILR